MYNIQRLPRLNLGLEEESNPDETLVVNTE